MKIFFITHTYSLKSGGGSEVFVSAYLRELRKRGHEVAVFAPGSARYPEEEKRLGIKAFYAPVFGHHALHKFQYTLFSLKAAFHARKFRPDVVHAQNDAFPGIIGCAVKKLAGRPLVLGLEGLSEKTASLNSKAVFLVNRLFLPLVCFDRIVSWSEFVKERFLLKWGIPEKKIAVVPGGIDTERFKNANPERFRKKFGKNFFVSVKPLNQTNSKALSFVVKAMETAVKRHPEYRYVIAGGGKGKKGLEALVKKLGLEKNVLFAGWVDAEELPEFYAAADFAVHSFIFRASTSVSLIESMAAGKAVVATESGEVKNALKGSGLLVEAENPESIARGLVKLMESPSLRKKLGEKAKKVAEKNYSIQAVAESFEEIYRGLAEKGKKRKECL